MNNHLLRFDQKKNYLIFDYETFNGASDLNNLPIAFCKCESVNLCQETY